MQQGSRLSRLLHIEYLHQRSPQSIILTTSAGNLVYFRVKKVLKKSSIIWPKQFLPGTTDNFVSNEIYITNLTAEEVWPNLVDITRWESYYDNVGQITPPSSGPFLRTKGENFSFSTFGFPPLQSEVCESVAPTSTSPGRLAWRAWQDGDDETALNVYHAWIIEDVEWGAVRILTQESQIGKPAAQLATTKPNPMLLGHQNWVEGLARISEGK
ncbi:hypothetical protein N7540_004958 [Penicillium herquei]|nr:hypothetical protein N7540_004958 [Penicillium herquei]